MKKNRLFCLLISFFFFTAYLTNIIAQSNSSPTIYDTAKIVKKVMVIIYNPVIKSKENKKLTQVYNWNDPDKLAEQYIKDVNEASWGLVEYKITERHEVNGFPVHVTGFRYDEESFMNAWSTKKFKDDARDYKKIIEEFSIIDKIENHKIDEVWLFGAPGFSWYESIMVGDGAYYCNSDPLTDVKCLRKFIIMGFNYERKDDCMLEDLGHRSESIIWHLYGTWEANENTQWNKFTLYDKELKGKSNVGNIHFAPNSQKDYEWGNKTYVESYCDDWYNYPNLTGKKSTVNCEEWGNGDMRLHHIWWFRHIPRAIGSIDGKLNNWWKYIMNYDEYK